MERMQIKQTEKNDYKHDTKFYRKRILHLTKNILYDEPPDDLLPDIKDALMQYVKCCSYYFNTLDRRDILQEEYKDITHNKSKENVLQDTIDEAKRVRMDTLMMRPFGHSKPSLDTFVVRNVVKQEPIILPKQKDIDLTHPLLRTKGIPETSSSVNALNEPEQVEPIEPKKKKTKDKKIGKKKNIVIIYGTEDEKKESIQ